MIKRIIRYFTHIYKDQDENIKTKASHTTFMLLLICLSVVIEVIFGAFFTPTTITDLAYDGIALLLFASMLLLVKKGKIILTGNLFVFAGLMKLIEFFSLTHLHQFYLQCFLSLIVCISIYIKKYQLYLTFFPVIILSIGRLIYVHQLTDIDMVLKSNLLYQIDQATIGVLLFIVIAYFYDLIIRSEISNSRQLKLVSETDILTNLYNRQKFDEVIEEFNQSNIQYTLALVDIDFFKRINDNYGHQIGDHVLSELARLFKNHFNEPDIVFRWGGEEFAIISTETSSDHIFDLLDEFRNYVSEHTFYENITLTVSIGYVISKINSKEPLLIHADKALYRAKDSGRNCVLQEN